MVGQHHQFAFGLITIDQEEHVRDDVRGSFPVGKHAGQPGDILVGRSAEHRAMIVNRVVVVEAAQEP
ncbi:hypothetical protein D3C79_1045200 [compost metagenome]